jgi:4-hydroxy-4-methyl-2-oxoglutarate aldolase
MSDESYTAESAEILALYKGLRLTDVGDALDYLNLMGNCIMDWQIRPLWRDGEAFTHRLYGVAHTARFVPTRKVVEPPKDFDEYRRWAGCWYRDFAPGPLGPFEPNSILIIDGSQTGQCGYIGSNNAQQWTNKGVTGIVTDGGCRDTDELILQKIPVYHKRFSRGIRPRRVELDGENVPVTCGGVHVCPGDIVVADNDGVVVVPREHAREVAKYAQVEANADKVTRRRLYEEAGMETDFTLEDV